MIKKGIQFSRFQIRGFLQRVFGHWSEDKLDAWMKYCFDPNQMLVDEDNGMIRGLLQFQPLSLDFDGQKYRCMVVDLVAIDPAFSRKTILSELFKEALLHFSSQAIFAAGYNMPFLEEQGFTAFDQMKGGWLEDDRLAGNSGQISQKKELYDLYSVYRSFMENFDGSILRDVKGFELWLDYLEQSGCNIIISTNAQKKADGFAVYKQTKNSADVLILVYESINAIFNLLTWLQEHFSDVHLQVGSGEDLSQLFSIKLDPSSRFYLKILHPELLRKLGFHHHKIPDIIGDLERYSWNGSLIKE